MLNGYKVTDLNRIGDLTAFAKRNLESVAISITDMVNVIRQNRSGLAKAKTDIKSNTEGITANEVDISSNTTGIATNATRASLSAIYVVDSVSTPAGGGGLRNVGIDLVTKTIKVNAVPRSNVDVPDLADVDTVDIFGNNGLYLSFQAVTVSNSMGIYTITYTIPQTLGTFVTGDSVMISFGW